MKSLRLQKTLLAAECMYHLRELEEEGTRILCNICISKQGGVVLCDVGDEVLLEDSKFGVLNHPTLSLYNHESGINILKTDCRYMSGYVVAIIEGT